MAVGDKDRPFRSPSFLQRCARHVSGSTVSGEHPRVDKEGRTPTRSRRTSRSNLLDGHGFSSMCALLEGGTIPPSVSLTRQDDNHYRTQDRISSVYLRAGSSDTVCSTPTKPWNGALGNRREGIDRCAVSKRIIKARKIYLNRVGFGDGAPHPGTSSGSDAFSFRPKRLKKNTIYSTPSFPSRVPRGGGEVICFRLRSVPCVPIFLIPTLPKGEESIRI